MASTLTVTGASGFLGSHCAKAALHDGWTVKGTVRPGFDVRPLRDALGAEDDRLRLSRADLSSEAGWDDAMQDADAVLHCASPFPIQQPKDGKPLINTAVEGTKRVLEAARRANVRRVIVTGSLNAVAGDKGKDVDYIYTDRDRTDPLDPTLTPYDRSKTLAESAVWDFAERHPDMEIVVIHPGAIYGPLLWDKVSASGEVIRALLAGDVPAVPRIGFACVDVRDVATAHLKAVDADVAGRRFLCSTNQVWLSDIAAILHDHYGGRGYNVPTRPMPDIVVKIGALFNPGLRRAKDHLGRTRQIDNRPIQKALEINFKSLDDMVVAMADSLIEFDVVEPG